jgi:hypothetical protein
VKRQLDICDTCYKSAFVDEGQADYLPMADPEIAKSCPFECRFTCRECVAKRDEKPN